MRASNREMKAYSSHIFAWAFKYQNETLFHNNLRSAGWKEFDKNPFTADDNHTGAFQDKYMLYQYLTKAARNIFCDRESAVCKLYSYGLSDQCEYQYYISGYDRGKKGILKEFLLDISDIELHIYGHGVGILFIQADYAPEEMLSYHEKQQNVRLINDYGRRITIPFLPVQKEGLLCAQKLGIVRKGCKPDSKSCLIEDFSEKIGGQEGSFDHLDQFAGFLNEILLHQLDAKYRSEASEKLRKDFQDCRVEPNNDDRMFVFCLIRDQIICDKIKFYTKKENLKKTTDKFQKFLYTFVYVEPDSYPTCQNADMREELLRKALYKRWSDEGTLYACTNYSFLCLTSPKQDINANVIRPFLLEYSYLLSLVLAQRTILHCYSERVGGILKKVKKDNLTNRRNTKKLLRLQEGYITFKNQILLLEASCQEQGIELYELLQRQMHVEQEQESLDNLLEGLYEIINTSKANRLGVYAFWIAVGAFGMDFIDSDLLKQCILPFIRNIFCFIGNLLVECVKKRL